MECPVAVSDIFAMPEQVGDAGLFFNPDSVDEIADCMLRLWEDDSLCETLVHNGKKMLNRWSAKRFQDEVIKIIEEEIV